MDVTGSEAPIGPLAPTDTGSFVSEPLLSV